MSLMILNKNRVFCKTPSQYLALSMFAICLFFSPSMEVLAKGGAVVKSGTEAIIATSTPIAIAFMVSMLVLKVTAFVLGYLIVKLGHDTMIKGVTGEVDFGFSGSGFQTKLKSASPGAFFMLMGAAIIIWGLTVEKPFAIEVPSPQKVVPTPNPPPANGGGLHRPVVPE